MVAVKLWGSGVGFTAEACARLRLHPKDPKYLHGTK